MPEKTKTVLSIQVPVKDGIGSVEFLQIKIVRSQKSMS